MDTSMSTPTELVITYMNLKKEVPLSIRNISTATGVKRRAVHAICEESEDVVKVHPVHVGSGMYENKLYVTSSNKKKWSAGSSNWE